MNQCKNILIYYSSMRSFLIYKKILKKHPSLFEIIIEMPALPYSRSKGKRNYSKFIKTAKNSPGYFFIQFCNIYIYKFLGKVSGNTIKNICKNEGIRHCYFNKINNELINFLKSYNPTYILNSSSSLLSKELLSIPKFGTLNLHEAPLPNYRGSAAYFWYLFNGELKAWVTCHYVIEKLDAGNIIFEGKKINLSKKMSIFEIWRKMLLSYDSIWNKLLPYLENEIKLSSKKQNELNAKVYSYPSKEVGKFLKKNKIKIFNFKDFIFFIKNVSIKT